MKKIVIAVIITALISNILVGCTKANNSVDVTGEWEIVSEISTELQERKIVRSDTSSFC